MKSLLVEVDLYKSLLVANDISESLNTIMTNKWKKNNLFARFEMNFTAEIYTFDIVCHDCIKRFGNIILS